MSTIAPLVTIEDYRRALKTTLDILEEVLSSDTDMPSSMQTMADADQWLDACRHAMVDAKSTETSQW
jgi:hypothetical protein